MFDCFADKYRKTTSEDHEEKCRQMAAEWHSIPPTDLKPSCYAFSLAPPLPVVPGTKVVDTGLHIIKHCSMYSEEYNVSIACK
jgi:hypothetical protein